MPKNLYTYLQTSDFKVESYHPNINVLYNLKIYVFDCPTVLKCNLICSENYDTEERIAEKITFETSQER